MIFVLVLLVGLLKPWYCDVAGGKPAGKVISHRVSCQK